MTNANEPLSRESLRRLVAARLDISPEELSEEMSLVELGMNSLEIMTIVNRIRRRGIPVTYAQMAAHPTLNSWQETIVSATKTLELQTPPLA